QAARRRDRDRGARHRPRHRRRGAAQAVHRVRAARLAQAARPRHRPGPGHLQAPRRSPRRPRRGWIESRPRLDLPFRGADGGAHLMKGRIFAVAALLALAVSVGVPLLYEELLGLGETQALLCRYCLGAFGPLATLAAALALYRLKIERKSVLELP